MPKLTVQSEGTTISEKRTVNLVAGENVTITATDNPNHGAVDIQIDAEAGGDGSGIYWITSDLTLVDQPLASSFLSFTTVTADSTSHTKGAYSEIIASTSAASTMAHVRVNNSGSTGVNTGILLDIATGAAASEAVVASNLQAGFVADTVGGTAASMPSTDFWLPLSIASGARVSARCQAAVAGGDTVGVHITLYSGTNKTVTAIDTIGANTATSLGTPVAGGNNNVEGEWVEIEDSTSAAYTGLLWALDGGDLSVPGGGLLLDIGTGAAAAETAIISDIVATSTSTEFIGNSTRLPIRSVNIPQGSRLSARVQAASGTAQSYGVTLYGLR